RVRDRVPDVTLAVAVEIDGIFLEIRRHELGVAHRARPRTLKLGTRRVLLLDDLERGDQLRAELVRPPPHEGLRGYGADRVIGHIDLPKPVSRPQMATTMLAGTPYCFWMEASVGRRCATSARPVADSPLSVPSLK